jgi:hypothetical protein
MIWYRWFAVRTSAASGAAADLWMASVYIVAEIVLQSRTDFRH